MSFKYNSSYLGEFVNYIIINLARATEFWVYGIFNFMMQFIMAIVFFSISLYNTCKACIDDNACREAQIKNDYDYGSFSEV